MSSSFLHSSKTPRLYTAIMASNMPHRSPMPIHSIPTPPFDFDPRDPRMMSAPMDSCRRSMDGPDYFGARGMGSFGPRHAGPSFPPPGFEPESMFRNGDQHVDDMVRRTNLMVQFVNCQVSYSARYSQIQPKMCMDGRFPNEFRVPRTVEEMKSMDPSTLDRLLRAYGLPTDLRSLRLTSQDSVSPKTAHQAKLCTLFDFLGAMQISERQRMRRTACLP
ncbi:hypothetical protein BDV96DRAFT_175844 [Lophiotrema nucula]|uniref:Uncharacterized protein n=1 Tax=Lophiotrema nucula TaxID=690887 RepID=A0A6A5YXS4_9PLEO|nr:hypothetical protein BDV96DRAFT_175844 [Lophiotrema nucula]